MRAVGEQMRPVAQHGIPRAGAHRPAGRRAHRGICEGRQERPQRVLADDDIPIAQHGNLAPRRGQPAVQRHRLALPRIGDVPHGDMPAAILIHDGGRLGVRADNQDLGVGRQLRQERIERPPDGRRLAIAGDDDADHRNAPDIEQRAAHLHRLDEDRQPGDQQQQRQRNPRRGGPQDCAGPTTSAPFPGGFERSAAPPRSRRTRRHIGRSLRWEKATRRGRPALTPTARRRRTAPHRPGMIVPRARASAHRSGSGSCSGPATCRSPAARARRHSG